MFSFDSKDRETLSFVEAVAKDKEISMKKRMEEMQIQKVIAQQMSESFGELLEEAGIFMDEYFGHPDGDKCL